MLLPPVLLIDAVSDVEEGGAVESAGTPLLNVLRAPLEGASALSEELELLRPLLSSSDAWLCA